MACFGDEGEAEIWCSLIDHKFTPASHTKSANSAKCLLTVLESWGPNFIKLQFFRLVRQKVGVGMVECTLYGVQYIQTQSPFPAFQV